MPTANIDASPRPPSLVRNRAFLLLWCAYAVSAVGDHLSEMAILKTQDALNRAVDVTPLSARMTFAFFFPFFLLSPFAGLLADWLPRRLLMIAADVARAVAMFCFAWVLVWTSPLGIWGPLLPLAFVGLFAAVFSPARSALLPTIVPMRSLSRANGLISGVGIVASMASAKIGGYLADGYEPEFAFRIDAATFLVSAVLIGLMGTVAPPAVQEPPRRGSATADLRAGLRYVLGHRHTRELLAVAALYWFCGALINSVLPALVRDVYEGTYTTISNYRTLLGVGFVVGAGIIALLGEALRGEFAITWGLLGAGASVVLLATSAFLPLNQMAARAVGGVGITLTGVFAVAVMASYSALLQRTTANRFRGRVFGVNDMCCLGALLLATGLLGWSDGADAGPTNPDGASGRWDRWAGVILGCTGTMLLMAGYVTLSIRLRRAPHGQILTLAEHFNEFLARFWWRLQRIGPSLVPRGGAVIVTANHTCSADPLFLSAAAPYRAISFMVAEEYTHWPVVRFFLHLVECIPVKRDGRDTAATKEAIRRLRAGKALGIFIEGGIVPPGQQPVPKDGVAMLALKTGAKVIPAHISGVRYYDSIVQGLLSRHRARVRFGPSVDLAEFEGDDPDRERLRAATRKIYAAIQALADRDCEPTGAPPPGEPVDRR
ncbi:MAG: MFS transporter [Planctomycetes bacterium]|nr:MFS transporter [Planctomycetota bacterium]